MNKRIPFFIGFVLLLLAVWLQTTSFPPIQHFREQLQHLAYDLQLRTKLLGHRAMTESSVAIVDIDDKSLSKEGRWPWPRAKLATLISRLQEQGAAVIALDMIFPEKEENIIDLISTYLSSNNKITPITLSLLKEIHPVFDNDATLANTLKQSDLVIGMTFLPRVDKEGVLPKPLLLLSTPEEQELSLIRFKGYISNIPILASSAKASGFINAFPDNDGIIRRAPLVVRYENAAYGSLALEAVRVYLLTDVKLLTAFYNKTREIEGLQVGNLLIPTDAEGQAIVPFRGKSFTYPYYSATDVLNKKIPPTIFQGKIIFVGTSATGLGDLPSTAIQSAFPGVEIQATLADGILSNRFSYKPAWALGAELFITITLGLILLFSFPYLGPRLLILCILIIPFLLITGNNFLWEKSGLIISILVPLVLTVALGVLNMLYGYLFETRRREQLKEIFGQYVPEKHIDEMLQTSGSYGMYGEEREMTVLFADIRNFTGISEHLPASQLKEMLNEFFTPMTEIIFKHNGTIDKYVGDLIMAFWGAPLKDKKHAYHAITAALEMQAMVKKMHPMLEEHGWPAIHIGIGLNSGLMSVGDMGSKFRRNYTVLGDAVNLASRVESLSKYYGVHIVITENTYHDQKHFIFRQLDRVRVKGKENGIGIYEVICKQTAATADVLKEVEQSQTALLYYFEGNWDKSIELFTELNTQHPHVKLYSLYLQRLAEFKLTPPSNWDGIYSHAFK